MSQTKTKNPNSGDCDPGQMLEGVEAMIWSIISSFSGLSIEDKKDIKQDVMIYLYQKVIPKFDPSRGTKFSSFAYRCIVNYVRRHLVNCNRKRIFLDNAAVEHYERAQTADKKERIHYANERLDGLFNNVTSNPECELKVKEKIVLLLMKANPGITQKEIADIMGYKHPSAISMLVMRMRKKIRRM